MYGAYGYAWINENHGGKIEKVFRNRRNRSVKNCEPILSTV